MIVFWDFLTRCTTLEARRRVANTLANEAANIALPTARYQKILWPLTPWELDDVTSCEECASKAWPHPNYVVADDGEQWPTKSLCCTDQQPGEVSPPHPLS